MKYHVWFDQVNQCCIEVSARTPETALKKAQREWKEDNCTPTWYMEDEKGEEVK